MGAFYLGNFVFKGLLVAVGGGRSTERDVSIEIAARALRDDELPVFTVLVPMFREPQMLPRLAESLRALDYPLGKLDIKLVLEAEDEETIAVAQTLGLEGVFEVIRVPPSQPQTKPKACNFALRFARGEYLVIYDAEDRPEPDQLRKVVETFRRAPPNTACLQCRLSYYNASENWLTRMFTLDYALWFDLVLPGLERLGIPIPLGGTSNHFKIDVLRELHAWDPFNVTEDADLGIRLTQKGYRVGVVDSTTFEEASCRAGQWIRQRTRWIKGYMQTFLVHTRRPIRCCAPPGRSGFLGFVFFIGGTVLSGLLNPIFWTLYLLELELKHGRLHDLTPLVGRLNRGLPVAFGAQTKSDRGYALKLGEERKAIRAKDITLDASQRAGAAFAQIGLSCLCHLAANQNAVDAGDGEGIHQMRVGLRRLRAAISLFASMLTDKETESIKTDLKWLTEQLGPARDVDVLVEEAIVPLRAANPDQPEIAILERDVKRERDEDIERAQAAVRSKRYRQAILRTALWLIDGHWTRAVSGRGRDRSVVAVATEILDRRTKKIVMRARNLRSLEARGRQNSASLSRSFAMPANSFRPCSIIQSGRSTLGEP